MEAIKSVWINNRGDNIISGLISLREPISYVIILCFKIDQKDSVWNMTDNQYLFYGQIENKPKTNQSIYEWKVESTISFPTTSYLQVLALPETQYDCFKANLQPHVISNWFYSNTIPLTPRSIAMKYNSTMLIVGENDKTLAKTCFTSCLTNNIISSEIANKLFLPERISDISDLNFNIVLKDENIKIIKSVIATVVIDNYLLPVSLILVDKLPNNLDVIIGNSFIESNCLQITPQKIIIDDFNKIWYQENVEETINQFHNDMREKGYCKTSV